MSADSCKSHLAVSEKVQLFLQTLRQKPTRAQHAVSVRERSVNITDGYRSLCTGTSRSGLVVRERRVRHEPASGRRRRRPAPARLAAAKAGQVGICGGCIGWDICSIRRDASMPPFEVSTARSASFVLGVLQCRIGTHTARARASHVMRTEASGSTRTPREPVCKGRELVRYISKLLPQQPAARLLA